MSDLSFYKEKPHDENAVYFETKDHYGRVDVSDILQDAIKSIVDTMGYGVLFVPSGKYLLSRTIYIPKAVRIIGYGKTRPEFILKDNAPDFDKPNPGIKGGYRYLFWFVNKIADEMDDRQDANPCTFYSAMSNVNVSLGKGNDYAVAFRTHYAQNSFLSHIDINIQSGMAGVYDVGNEMEDVSMNGGQYGIISTKCSPGWPFVMMDCRFSNHSHAAIKSREVGLTIIRTHCKHTSNFIDVDEGYFEKIYIENSIFEDMNSVLSIALDQNALTQINMINCQLRSVENVAEYLDTGRNVASEDYQCMVKKYVHGVMVSDVYPDKQVHDQVYRYASEINYNMLKTDIPKLPEMDTWVNAKEHGLAGDGISDDTLALKRLIRHYDTIYFPQGEYLLSDTILLGENTALIGMNPASTKLILKENAENFTGFGKAKAFIETSKGKNMIIGLGIDTGGRNPRACGVKWLANEESYMNDIKFYGGHGTLGKNTSESVKPYDEGRVRDASLNKMWDYQYPSLLITDGGGGIFKDIWSASPYTTAGVQIQNTMTPTKIYCLSVEHHLRCELRMNHAENVRIYGFQCEEESAEGEFAQPIELHHCKNIIFATAYFFRTIFVQRPFDYCVKTWNCEKIKFMNVHNYSQMKYTITNFLLDVVLGIELRPWQATVAEITSADIIKENQRVSSDKISDIPEKIEQTKRIKNKKEKVRKLYSGFRFLDGGACDGNGNFFCLDSLNKKIYRIDGKTLEIELYFESPYKVNSVGFDTKDHIIVVGEYFIPKDATQNGEPVVRNLPPDSYGTSYAFWYNKSAQMVVFTIDANREIKNLDEIEIGSIRPERVLYAGNRWRDGNDFSKVVTYNPKKAVVAPDGVTIIPLQYDLIRANNLARSKPGRKLYSVDELYKCVYMCEITEDGLLTNPTVIINEGDYRVKKQNDRIYVGADNIKVYDNKKYIETIYLPERPITFDFGGIKKEKLFVTTAHSIYLIEM